MSKNISNNRAYALYGKNQNILVETGPDSLIGTICESELDKLIEEHK